MAIDFKDVGVLKQPGLSYQERNRTAKPIGFKTPFEIDRSSNALFAMHTDVRSQIADNLRNLVNTNWGERLGLYDFGANLRELVTDYSNQEDFENEAAVRINTAISRWMPFITPVNMDSYADVENNEVVGKIKLIITYAIPALNVSNDQLEVTLSVI